MAWTLRRWEELRGVMMSLVNGKDQMQLWPLLCIKGTHEGEEAGKLGLDQSGILKFANIIGPFCVFKAFEALKNICIWETFAFEAFSYDRCLSLKYVEY